MELSNNLSSVILIFAILEFPNVERPIFQNFEISNIKITKVVLLFSI